MRRVFALVLSMAMCMASVTTGIAENAQPAKWTTSDVVGNAGSAGRPEARDDFHAHVNFDWLTSARIQDGKTTMSSFVEQGEAVKAEIKTLLLDETQPSHEAELARNLYAVAQNMDKRNALGMSPIQDEFDQILSIQTLDDLTDYLGRGAYPFGSPLMTAGITEDMQDSTRYIVMIAPRALSLNDSDEYTGALTD